MSTVRDGELGPWGFEGERKGEMTEDKKEGEREGEWEGNVGEKETDKNSSHIRNTQVFVRSNVNVSFDPVFL